MSVCTAEDHLELSRITSSEIVEPLKHLVRLEAAGVARVDRTGTSVLTLNPLSRTAGHDQELYRRPREAGQPARDRGYESPVSLFSIALCQSGELPGVLPNGTLACSEHSFNSIQALTTSVGTYTNSPLTVSAEQDPLIVRAQTESLMREQITKENELLGIVKQWQGRTKTFEAESFATIASAVQKWEVER